MIATSTRASVVTLENGESRSITEHSYAPGDRVTIHSSWPSLMVLISGSWRGTCPTLPEHNSACSLILVPPGVLLSGYAGASNLHCLRIELKTGLQHAILAGSQSIHRGGEPTRRAMKIFWALQQSIGMPQAELEVMIGGLLLCLAQDREKIATRMPPSWLQVVLERLHVEYRKPPGLRDLAQAASVDSCHLARTFRRYLRCTIGQYVRQLRLEEAVRRMLGCDHRLAEIAAATGLPTRRISHAPSSRRSASRRAIIGGASVALNRSYGSHCAE